MLLSSSENQRHDHADQICGPARNGPSVANDVRELPTHVH